MSKVEKCTDCGAIRIVKDDLCKRCKTVNGQIKAIGGAAE